MEVPTGAWKEGKVNAPSEGVTRNPSGRPCPASVHGGSRALSRRGVTEVLWSGLGPPGLKFGKGGIFYIKTQRLQSNFTLEFIQRSS